MIGWRLGYVAAPDAVAKAIDSIQSHTTANPSSFSQRGALAALKGDQQSVADMRDRKSTRLNSSHANISYAVLCLKKKETATRNSVVSSKPSQQLAESIPAGARTRDW